MHQQTPAPSPALSPSTPPLFRRIDTVVLRVRDLQSAVRWYRTKLGLDPVYSDDGARLAVLGLDGTSLTLWEVDDAAAAAPNAPPATFPIFSTDDAAAARELLAARGVTVGPLEIGEGVRFFRITDLDGNALEACQLL